MRADRPCNVSQLATLFLAWASKNMAPGTVDGYRRHLTRFAAVVGAAELHELRPFDLTNWENRWHPIQAVQRLFSWAKDEAGLVDVNPFRLVKRPPIGNRKRILDRRETLLLLRRARPDFRAYLLALRESIARPQEIRACTWEDLHWRGTGEEFAIAITSGEGAFFLEDYKARRRRADANAPRVVPVSPRLGRLLQRLSRRMVGRHGHVWLNSEGRPWTTNAVRLRMARLRDLVGLGEDHRGERVVCYTFRHTAATEASSLGLRDRLLADVMGHTSTRTTARYQHLQADHLLAAVRELAKRKQGRG